MTSHREYRWLRFVLLAPLLAAGLYAQAPEINTVLNAASADQRPEAPPLAPGSWVSIFGNRFAAQLPATATTPLSIDNSMAIPLQTSLGGKNGLSPVSVTFDGVTASLGALIRTAGFDQINAQIPWGVDITDGQVQMTVTRDGQSMSTMGFEAADASPGVFTTQFGAGPAIVTNVAFAGGPADVVSNSYAQAPGTICTAGNSPGCAEQAAPVGGVVIIWCNGLGPVDVPVRSGDVPEPGQVGPLGYVAAVKPVKVFIGGTEAQVIGAALSSDNVALNQVSAVVPNIAPNDAVSVQLEMEVRVGNEMRVVRTRPDVTMSVRAAPASAALIVP